jgi:hypothetical protein
VLDLLSDILQFALGMACVALSFFALFDSEANWAAKHLKRFIEENWAGSTPRSYRNLAIASTVPGAILVASVVLSRLLS